MGQELLVRAGVNWNPGVVGEATIPAGRGSAAGHALRTNAPVISDVATERRFSTPRLLIEHGVQSTVNVVIRGEKGPFGVLEVNSRQRRSFGQDDIDFLQNYANLLASAVDRLDRQQELEEGMKRQQFLFNELQHRVNNMLTTIRAVARRTRAHRANLDQFAKALDDRLSALARIHNLFSHPGKMAATMREILTQELSAQGAVEGNNFCRAHVEQRGIGCWPLDHHGSNGGRAAEEEDLRCQQCLAGEWAVAWTTSQSSHDQRRRGPGLIGPRLAWVVLHHSKFNRSISAYQSRQFPEGGSNFTARASAANDLCGGGAA